jgi:four helix bundle protein
MAMIQSFRDLDVYKIARQQAKKIFVVTQRFPREERYSLIDQIRRSSRAVNAILAEGWGRRRYQPSFINKVTESLGEAMETQAWLDHALDCDYLTQSEHRELDDAWQHIGAMLNSMIRRADDFCRSASRQ